MENIVPTLENVPIGFRFRPKDEELVNHYLRHKLLDDDIRVNIIPEIDLCKVDPWEVPAKSMIKSEDPEWFFFSPVGFKYSNSKRVNRTTKGGFWKSTGNDRYIKEKGTNNVIGTKKTLVFYKGRVSRSVKSNWVIHEYHLAVTFPESQTTFVLCRLMKKDGKKDERGTGALICDEAEPNRNKASEYENQVTSEGIADVGSTLPEMSMDTIFPVMHEEEKYFPQEQLSPIAIEQEAYFTNSPFHDDAYFRNENIIMQTPFETIEEENEFISSLLVNNNVINKQQTEHVFINSSIQSKSLKRLHCESDTDVEVVSALCGNIGGTSTTCDECPSSGEYHPSKMLKSSHGMVHGGVYLLSSNHEENKKQEKSIIPDDFWGVDTSSCDSTTDKPSEYNYIDISSSPSTLRRWKNQYHPRPDNCI